MLARPPTKSVVVHPIDGPSEFTLALPAACRSIADVKAAVARTVHVDAARMTLVFSGAVLADSDRADALPDRADVFLVVRCVCLRATWVCSPRTVHVRVRALWGCCSSAPEAAAPVVHEAVPAEPESEACAICLEEYGGGSFTPFTLACRHAFHHVSVAHCHDCVVCGSATGR
jgi:hypothetical protein